MITVIVHQFNQSNENDNFLLLQALFSVHTSIYVCIVQLWCIKRLVYIIFKHLFSFSFFLRPPCVRISEMNHKVIGVISRVQCACHSRRWVWICLLWQWIWIWIWIWLMQLGQESVVDFLRARFFNCIFVRVLGTQWLYTQYRCLKELRLIQSCINHSNACIYKEIFKLLKGLMLPPPPHIDIE